MQELEVTIMDGDTVVVSGVDVDIDSLEGPAGSPEGSGWHAHALLSLSVVLAPGQQLQLQTPDGRVAPVVVEGPPAIEGGEALYLLKGLAPLERPRA